MMLWVLDCKQHGGSETESKGERGDFGICVHCGVMQVRCLNLWAPIADSSVDESLRDNKDGSHALFRLNEVRSAIARRNGQIH